MQATVTRVDDDGRAMVHLEADDGRALDEMIELGPDFETAVLDRLVKLSEDLGRADEQTARIDDLSKAIKFDVPVVFDAKAIDARRGALADAVEAFAAAATSEAISAEEQ